MQLSNLAAPLRVDLCPADGAGQLQCGSPSDAALLVESPATTMYALEHLRNDAVIINCTNCDIPLTSSTRRMVVLAGAHTKSVVGLEAMVPTVAILDGCVTTAASVQLPTRSWLPGLDCLRTDNEILSLDREKQGPFEYVF